MADDKANSAATIASRLAFMQIDAQTIATLRQVKPLLDRALPTALDAFYARVRQTAELQKFFRNDAHMDHAKSAQVQHWQRISAGDFNAGYLQQVHAIGQAHARIGLDPSWYSAGYAMVAEHLVHAVIEHVTSSRFSWRTRGEPEISVVVGAVIRAVLLDLGLSATAYASAADEARIKGEERAKTEERSAVAQSFGAGLAQLAGKNLSFRLESEVPAAYGALRDDFNTALTQMEEAILEVQSGVNVVSSSSGEIASAADDLARRTERQAASIEETAAAIQEVTNTVRKSAENATEARRVITSTREKAVSGGALIKETITAVNAIETSSREINQIISVIDEIAFQTNLLALNAGVEAARAGDAGRGFAVVAAEVRALAQRSATAAKEIKALIQASGTEVARGVTLVAETGAALDTINTEVGRLHAIIVDFAASSEQQAQALAEVNDAVGQMDQTTQQNAALVEQSTAASHALSAQAERLHNTFKSFKVRKRRPSLSVAAA